MSSCALQKATHNFSTVFNCCACFNALTIFKRTERSNGQTILFTWFILFKTEIDVRKLKIAQYWTN